MREGRDTEFLLCSAATLAIKGRAMEVDIGITLIIAVGLNRGPAKFFGEILFASTV